jgi:hypothetical protein
MGLPISELLECRAGLPPLRLIVSVDPKLPTDDPKDPVAEVRGVNRHARQVLTDGTVDDWNDWHGTATPWMTRRLVL